MTLFRCRGWPRRDRQPLISVGRTVAVGDPRDPIAYLTTLRLADGHTARSAPAIKSLDGQL